MSDGWRTNGGRDYRVASSVLGAFGGCARYPFDSISMRLMPLGSLTATRRPNPGTSGASSPTSPPRWAATAIAASKSLTPTCGLHHDVSVESHLASPATAAPSLVKNSYVSARNWFLTETPPEVFRIAMKLCHDPLMTFQYLHHC